MNYFFTADEHYWHTNIIKYCNRPFKSTEEMDKTIIKNHNSMVKEEDIVYHIWDFTLRSNAEKYIKRLNGKHIFIRWSHDKWMDDSYHEIIEKKTYFNLIVMCHYKMSIWPKSHYNSWLLYGHSHWHSKEEWKSIDVWVDTNNFFPYSLEDIVNIMKRKPDNFNLIWSIWKEH